MSPSHPAAGQRQSARAAAVLPAARSRSGAKKKKLTGVGADKAAGKRKSQHGLKLLKDLEKENRRLLKLLRQNEEQLKEAREDAQVFQIQDGKTKKRKTGKGASRNWQAKVCDLSSLACRDRSLRDVLTFRSGMSIRPPQPATFSTPGEMRGAPSLLCFLRGRSLFSPCRAQRERKSSTLLPWRFG